VPTGRGAYGDPVSAEKVLSAASTSSYEKHRAEQRPNDEHASHRQNYGSSSLAGPTAQGVIPEHTGPDQRPS
jgi:hypothetical protein